MTPKHSASFIAVESRTFNLCFLGMVLAYKAIPTMVDEANRLLSGGPLMQQNVAQTNQQSVVVNVVSPVPALGPSVRDVIKVRCGHCGTLSDEKTGRCGECGAKIYSQRRMSGRCATLDDDGLVKRIGTS